MKPCKFAYLLLLVLGACSKPKPQKDLLIIHLNYQGQETLGADAQLEVLVTPKTYPLSGPPPIYYRNWSVASLPALLYLNGEAAEVLRSDSQFDFRLIDGSREFLPMNFQLIGGVMDVRMAESLGLMYMRDGVHAYYGGKAIEGADPGTFEILEFDFSRDAEAIYHMNKKAPVDPASFVILNNRHARDKSKILFDGEVMSGVDVASFTLLSFSHAKDKNQVYYDGKILNGADSGSFQAFDSSYGKDGKSVFYLAQILPQFDAASFQVACSQYEGHPICSEYRGDANGSFYTDMKIPGVKIQDIRLYGNSENGSYNRLLYATNGSNVFFRGAVIPEADPASFVVIDSKGPSDCKDCQHFARDKSHYFDGTQFTTKEEAYKYVDPPEVGRP